MRGKEHRLVEFGRKRLQPGLHGGEAEFPAPAGDAAGKRNKFVSPREHLLCPLKTGGGERREPDA